MAPMLDALASVNQVSVCRASYMVASESCRAEMNYCDRYAGACLLLSRHLNLSVHNGSVQLPVAVRLVGMISPRAEHAA
jgi:hypothetical protein